MPKKKKKFKPKRAKKQFQDSFHEFSGSSIHDGQPVTIEADKEPIPVTVHDALQVSVIGVLRNEKPVRNLESTELQEGDELFFVLHGGWAEVWKGTIGPRGTVWTMRQVAWHQKGVIWLLQLFGYVEPVPLVNGDSISIAKPRKSSGGGSKSPGGKLATDLPTDEAELRQMLADATDKGDKRRIRGQLRKVNPNWAKK